MKFYMVVKYYLVLNFMKIREQIRAHDSQACALAIKRAHALLQLVRAHICTDGCKKQGTQIFWPKTSIQPIFFFLWKELFGIKPKEYDENVIGIGIGEKLYLTEWMKSSIWQGDWIVWLGSWKVVFDGLAVTITQHDRTVLRSTRNPCMMVWNILVTSVTIKQHDWAILSATQNLCITVCNILLTSATIRQGGSNSSKNTKIESILSFHNLNNCIVSPAKIITL